MLRLRRRGACALAACLTAAAVLALAEFAFAQGSPFGAGPSPVTESGGFGAWIFTQQARFFRALSAAIREAKADGGAALGLYWLSFLYGIFHAAGPGHGKAVISSYLLADGSTIPRGVALSAAASLAQAATAIALVAVAAVALGATARAMGETVRWLELGSYALIFAVGVLLAWRKGRALLAALTAWRGGKSHERLNHAHDHAHDHTHGPEPAELKGKGWLRRGLATVAAVGIRPCSGAILVLVFTLSQGIFFVGVVSTLIMAAGTAATVSAIAILAVGAKGVATRIARSRPGAGMLAVRGLEFAAALLVIAVGVLLMSGLMASERMFPA